MNMRMTARMNQRMNQRMNWRVDNQSQGFLSEHRTPFDRGYVQVYTGDGKGKTTAALGLAVRAVGAGLRVYLAQFIKSEPYSEMVALERLGDRITCRQFGRGCWLRGEPAEEDRRLAREAMTTVGAILVAGRHEVVILDEINVATHFGLVEVEAVLALLDRRPAHVELVLTGRRADPRVVARADLVTEMIERKHYYQQGVLARTGIES